MMTEIRRDLIRILKHCGLDKNTTIAITILCKTDENRLRLMEAIATRYEQKGTVTEEDIQKMLLMITGQRKE